VIDVGAHLDDDKGTLAELRMRGEESAEELEIAAGRAVVLGWGQLGTFTTNASVP